MQTITGWSDKDVYTLADTIRQLTLKGFIIQIVTPTRYYDGSGTIASAIIISEEDNREAPKY